MGTAALPTGEGSLVLPLPKEGTSFLYSLHCWTLQLYGSTCSSNPSVPRVNGGNCSHHPHVGVRPPPLHPGEGRLRAAHLPAPPAVQDVALVPVLYYCVVSCCCTVQYYALLCPVRLFQ